MVVAAFECGILVRHFDLNVRLLAKPCALGQQEHVAIRLYFEHTLLKWKKRDQFEMRDLPIG